MSEDTSWMNLTGHADTVDRNAIEYLLQGVFAKIGTTASSPYSNKAS